MSAVNYGGIPVATKRRQDRTLNRMVDRDRLRALIERDYGERGIARFARDHGWGPRKVERWVSPTKPQQVSAADIPRLYSIFPELRGEVPIVDMLAQLSEQLDRLERGLTELR